MKTLTFFILLIISALAIHAQGVGINASGSAPDASAILDVSSNTKGFLPPRMTTTERDAISTPATGLVIFNTTTNCLNFYSSGQWSAICEGCSPQPTAANAGPDQQDVVGTTTTLSGNQALSGTGGWSIISGSGGSFTNPALYNTTFTGQSNESYTLRWTISNNCGSSQDDVTISFLAVFVCGTSTVEDAEFNAYATVQIGSQCWMAENLNLGVQINGTGSPSNNSTVEKYCYQDNAANCTSDGGLYTWDEAMDYNFSSSSNPSGVQGICPTGWHLPSDEEWKDLELTLGMSSGVLNNTGWRGTNQGTQLKVGGSSGFEGILGGYRDLPAGNWFGGGFLGFFWTSTAPNSADGWARMLQDTQSGVRRDPFTRTYGWYVRCVKD